MDGLEGCQIRQATPVTRSNVNTMVAPSRASFGLWTLPNFTLVGSAAFPANGAITLQAAQVCGYFRRALVAQF